MAESLASLCRSIHTGSRIARALAMASCLLWHVLSATTAHAHALDPVLFELTERADGKVDVLWKAPNMKVPGLDLVPELPPECQRVGEIREETTTDEEDATVSRWVVDCGAGLVGKTVGIAGLESTDALVRVTLQSGATDRRVLGAGHATLLIEGDPSRVDVLHDYARLGLEHIASGLDHLLFVFGLLLLVGSWRPLVATITAFTLGHSVTLALASLELVSVPQAPVEVVIAISIYVLAVELSREVSAQGSLLRRWPWGMAFCFGLLHGLGFAGALREAGLPSSEVPLALLSFNLGIEAGQVFFVAIALLSMASLRSVVAAVPPWVRRVPVYAMGTAASYWILVRATALL